MNAHWELYDIKTDFSQNRDLAIRFPGKVKELDSLWWVEARKYQVLPLDGTAVDRLNVPRASFISPRDTFVYFQGSSLVKASVAAPTLNRSYRIKAEIKDMDKQVHGVLLAQAGSFGGWSFYILDNYLFFDYNWIGREIYSIRSDRPLPVGDLVVEMDFVRNPGTDKGLGGEATLFVNGKVAGEGQIPHTNKNIYWPSSEGLTCGYDHLSPVSKSYRSPFRFTGNLERVTVVVDPK